MLDVSEPIVQLLGSPQLLDGAANVSGESDLVAAANITALGVSALTAESDLVAAGIGVLLGSSALTFESDLAITVNIAAAAASIQIASSNLSAEATNLSFAVARNIVLNVVGSFTAQVAHPVAARPMVAGSDVEATMYTNPRLLVLPTVEYAYTDNVLLRRYPIHNGQSLVITNGVGRIADFISQDQISEADYFFGGGRRHELTPTEEAAVVAAGYGDLIVTEYL